MRRREIAGPRTAVETVHTRRQAVVRGINIEPVFLADVDRLVRCRHTNFLSSPAGAKRMTTLSAAQGSVGT